MLQEIFSCRFFGGSFPYRVVFSTVKVYRILSTLFGLKFTFMFENLQNVGEKSTKFAINAYLRILVL